MTERRQYCPKGHDTFQIGRDTSGRCLQCKKEAGRATRYLRIAEDRGIREAERRRRQEEELVAEEEAFRRRQEERKREQEQKYRAAIKRGGYDANMARWERASDELYETGSRYALCQWEDEGPDGEFLGRTCYRRTVDVYCSKHNAKLERKTARKAKEAKR